jgi:hypothetical protein
MEKPTNRWQYSDFAFNVNATPSFIIIPGGAC